jgi:hypothetical protein
MLLSLSWEEKVLKTVHPSIRNIVCRCNAGNPELRIDSRKNIHAPILIDARDPSHLFFRKCGTVRRQNLGFLKYRHNAPGVPV